MKPLRILSPIEPGELCWVKVDGEWWLVRAADTRLTGCEECCFANEVCPPLDCEFAWSRVHPIPMTSDYKVGDIIIMGNAVGIVGVAEDNDINFTRIGPPEE